MSDRSNIKISKEISICKKRFCVNANASPYGSEARKIRVIKMKFERFEGEMLSAPIL